MMKLPDTCKGFAYVLLSATGLLLSSGCGTTGTVTPGSTISQCARGEGEVPQTTQQAEAGVAKAQVGITVEKENLSDSKAHEKLDAASRIEEALKMIAAGPLAGAYIVTAGGHLPTYPGLVGGAAIGGALGLVAGIQILTTGEPMRNDTAPARSTQKVAAPVRSLRNEPHTSNGQIVVAGLSGGNYVGELRDGKRHGYGEVRYRKNEVWISI